MDHATGFVMAMGTCAALCYRAQSGEGRYISTSMFATALAVQAAVARSPIFDATGRDQVVARIRAERERGASYSELLAARGFRIHGPIGLYFKGYNAKDGGFILGANTAANREQIPPLLGLTDDPTASPDFDALNPAGQDARVVQMERRIGDIMTSRAVADASRPSTQRAPRARVSTSARRWPTIPRWRRSA